MTKAKNYYDILKLKSDCTASEIKKSFIKLSKKHHPDKNENSKASHERFIDINEAYSTLSNPEKRRIYDGQMSRGSTTQNMNREYYYRYSPSSYYSASSTNAGNKNNTFNRMIFRLAVLPKLVIVAALILMTAFSTGLQLTLIKDQASTRRQMMENKSVIASLILQNVRAHGKDGTEKQLQKLRDGTLGVYDINEILDEYLRLQAEKTKPK